MASIFGAAFDKLPRETQLKLSRQLSQRRLLYTSALQRRYVGNNKVILIGDKPGPGRPTTPHHHTPFYSTKNSSLWLNLKLVEAGIDELDLLWFNAELADGSPLDPVHIQDLEPLQPKLIALGGNAEKWIRRAVPEVTYVKVPHPQFAKRFKSKEPYELIDVLKETL